MKLELAIHVAKTVTSIRPDYVVCGSLGLILLEVIPLRDIHDIDFSTTKDEFDPTGLHTYGDYGPMPNEGYDCWKISGDNRTLMYYNVFVHESQFNIHPDRVFGMRVQSIGDMLKYKAIYGRKKDKEDFMNINPLRVL